MTDTGATKSKSGGLDAEEKQRDEGRFTSEQIKQQAVDDLGAEEKHRDEEHRAEDRSEQQNLNQGMDTGTHDSIHRGVNWKPEFRVHTPASRKPEKLDKKDEPDQTSKP